MAKDTTSPNHHQGSERRLTSSTSLSGNAGGGKHRRSKTVSDPTSPTVTREEDNNAAAGMVPPANDLAKHRSSSTPLENPTTVESERVVREFSQNTALYTVLALSIGTGRDGRGLREDLSKIRNKAHDLARQGKSLLVPRMKKPTSDCDVQKEYERIFFIFCSCLECYCEQLLRTSDLLIDFVSSVMSGASIMASIGASDQSIHSAPSYINTGITDPYPNQTYLRTTTLGTSGHLTNSRRGSNYNLRGSRRGSTTGTGCGDSEELSALHREIQAVKDMILDIHSSVAINPWTVQPDFDPSRYFSTGGDALNSDEEYDGDSETSSKRLDKETNSRVPNSIVSRHSRKRCLCLVIVISVSVILFATVLGVCIVLLT